MGFMVKANGRWPNGIIYYRLSAETYKNKEFNDRQNAMIATMLRWQDLVNNSAGKNIINFKKINTRVERENHIYITMGALGSKGVVPGGKNDTSGGPNTIAGRVGLMIGDNVGGISKLTLCSDIENYPHEVGHILGLGHEHMRPDDKKVLAHALPQAALSQGWNGLTVKGKLTGARAEEKKKRLISERSKCEVGNTQHDFKSIMHYKGDSIKDYFDGTDGWETKGIDDKREKDHVKNGTWKPSEGDISCVVSMYKN